MPSSEDAPSAPPRPWGGIAAVSGGILILAIAVGAVAWWSTRPPTGCGDRLSRSVLEQSLTAGTAFLLNQQREAGNFGYEYDWVSGVDSTEDNQVRQAGALWGLSLIHAATPTQPLADGISRGLSFFRKNSVRLADGRRYVVYPEEKKGALGTVALVSLALIDFLRATPTSVDATTRASLLTELREYLDFLRSARHPSGLWHGSYDLATGTPEGEPSSYFDGETLLALTKAARHLGHDELRELVVSAAHTAYEKNVRDALAKDPDSAVTKGFYQWSSMAFFELAESGWSGTEPFAERVIELADWMIDIHDVEGRSRNTGYATEGLIHAYALALRLGRADAQEKFRCTSLRVLEKLTTWQVGGPMPNAFIREHAARADNPLARGGVQNAKNLPGLRIDVAQHQMHGVLLALRHLFPKDALAFESRGTSRPEGRCSSPCTRTRSGI